MIKLIFSSGGIFKCIEEGYCNAPVNIVDVLSHRAKEFLPTSELVVLKKMVFSNLAKLEDVNKKAKLILEKHKTLIQQRNKTSVDLSNSDSKSEHSLNT